MKTLNGISQNQKKNFSSFWGPNLYQIYEKKGNLLIGPSACAKTQTDYPCELALITDLTLMIECLLTLFPERNFWRKRRRSSKHFYMSSFSLSFPVKALFLILGHLQPCHYLIFCLCVFNFLKYLPITLEEVIQ